MAVRNEERAFAFWSYVAAHAEAPEIRRAAEAMAHEELGHVSILRRERRKAYHAERSASGLASERGGDARALAALERRLAELLDSLAGQSPLPERTRLTDFAGEARRHAEELEDSSISASRVVAGGRLPDDPVAVAELLAERYLEAGDTVRDEAVLARVQVLAGHAINRLAWLRADLPELGQVRIEASAGQVPRNPPSAP
jgi:hypothetical protein